MTSTQPRKVKRATPGMQQGAQVRVEAKKPQCPQHMTAMKYDPEDTRWACPVNGCVIVSYQRGDHVNGTHLKYEGDLGIVVDKRTGYVWLRLAPSSYTGDAMMVLLSKDYTVRNLGNLPGVDTVDLQGQPSSKEAQVVFTDLVTVDHSGRLRR